MELLGCCGGVCVTVNVSIDLQNLSNTMKTESSHCYSYMSDQVIFFWIQLLFIEGHDSKHEFGFFCISSRMKEAQKLDLQRKPYCFGVKEKQLGKKWFTSFMGYPQIIALFLLDS